jgi:hypothetical protein
MQFTEKRILHYERHQLQTCQLSEDRKYPFESRHFEEEEKKSAKIFMPYIQFPFCCGCSFREVIAETK